MKCKVFLVISVLSLCAAVTALADDKEKAEKSSKDTQKQKAEKATAKSSEQPKAMVTGSNIPQKVRKHGLLTDGVSQVIIVDDEAIKRTGATDVRQALARNGAH